MKVKSDKQHDEQSHSIILTLHIDSMDARLSLTAVVLIEVAYRSYWYIQILQTDIISIHFLEELLVWRI